MITKRVMLLASAAIAVGLNAGGLAIAQSYPNRTIRLVLPFPPGGATEFINRLVADRLSSRFRQPVIVENRPGGAGGTVGAKAVATADPDGYTLLLSPPGPLVTAAAIYKNLDYDPSTSFAPVALMFSSPQVLAVNPGVPAKTIPELVAYAKSNPGKISFASPGFGTQPHLLGEMLKLAAGIDIVHVPYRGPAPAITDLLAGQVQLYFETTPSLLPHIEVGKIRALAIAGEARIRQLPDVPTAIESGFPTLLAGFWLGMLAPAGTPERIVNQLNVATNEILLSQEAQTGLAKLGAEARVGSPQEFAAFIASETKKWTAVAKGAGVKID